VNGTMTAWDANPFAILTFIAAPAILTNASSVMALGTSNRFARAVDRARALARAEPRGDPAEAALRDRQLAAVGRRGLLLVRALTAFYLSVGSFAAASLVSLLGAAAVVVQQSELRAVSFGVALAAGVAGVGGLVTGSAILVFETRLTLRILRDELAFRRKQVSRAAGGQPPV
jgi:hypothetical protein